jgi:hypothetical protein
LVKQENKLTGYSFRRNRKLEATSDVVYQVEVSNDDNASPFRLTAFGLPEPVDTVEVKQAPRYVWFLAAAGVFTLLAFGFRSISRRRTAAVRS